MTWTLYDERLRNPWLALAIDEAVCHFFAAKEFESLIRVWRNPSAICFGRTCDASLNAHGESLLHLDPGFGRSHFQNKTVLLRRASGGGTVLHGPGNWNYSIIVSLDKFPEVFPVKQSYERFLGLAISALAQQGIEAHAAGQSDLVTPVQGELRKFSGNAQFRKRGICVHHGTLLEDSSLISGISRALPHPPKEPDYRAGRSHDRFLGSLPAGFSISQFARDLSSATASWTGSEVRPLSADVRKKIFQLAGKLAKKIYTNREWILQGKAPDFH